MGIITERHGGYKTMNGVWMAGFCIDIFSYGLITDCGEMRGRSQCGITVMEGICSVDMSFVLTNIVPHTWGLLVRSPRTRLQVMTANHTVPSQLE